MHKKGDTYTNIQTHTQLRTLSGGKLSLFQFTLYRGEVAIRGRTRRGHKTGEQNAQYSHVRKVVNCAVEHSTWGGFGGFEQSNQRNETERSEEIQIKGFVQGSKVHTRMYYL